MKVVMNIIPDNTNIRINDNNLIMFDNIQLNINPKCVNDIELNNLVGNSIDEIAANFILQIEKQGGRIGVMPESNTSVYKFSYFEDVLGYDPIQTLLNYKD